MASISPERRAMLESEKRKNAGGPGNYFTTKDLTTAVIRLTPLLPTEQVGTKVVKYFINNRFYICNEATNGKPGVIARAIRALTKLDDPKAPEILAVLDDNRNQRYLTKIIIRGAEAEGVKFFPAPRGIYDVIVAAFREDGEDISHALEGRDIRISKSGSGKTTEYSARIKDVCPLMPTKEERVAIKAMAQSMLIEDEIAADEQGAVEALMAVIPPQVWVKIKKDVVAGLNLDAGADDDDTPAPAPASTGRKSPPRGAPTADDEGEETAAPAPKAKPAPVAADDEDTPAPPAKAKPAPVASDEDETPPPRAAKPAPATTPVAGDDEEDAPVRAATKPAPTKPAAAPAAKPRYAAASSDDE